MAAGDPKQHAYQARIPELDGLRGLAILGVMMVHYGYPGGAPRWWRYFERSLSLGWASVDLFFVLSGFLIGGILLDTRTSPSFFRTFYLRRIYRIIPLYYGWILGYVLLVVAAGGFLRTHMHAGVLPGTWAIVWQHLLFLQTLWSVPYVTLSAAWFMALWSLAVEEQYYLVVPLLTRFLSSRQLCAALGVTVCCAPALRVILRRVESPAWLGFSLMPCRADSLAIGMLAAIVWRDEAFRAWMREHDSVLTGTFGVFLAGMLVLWRWFPDKLGFVAQLAGYTWADLFWATVILLVLALPGGLVARFTRLGWLREIGRVSYCMYIIHGAIRLACHFLWQTALPRASTAGFAAIPLLAGALTFVIAKLSWRYFERPFLDIGHSYHYEPAPTVK